MRTLLSITFVGLSLAAPLRHHRHEDGRLSKMGEYDYEDPISCPDCTESGSGGPAHISDEGRRVDQCVDGMIENVHVVSTRMPGAPANNSKVANKMIADYVAKMMKAAPQCYVGTGQPPQPSADSGIVSNKYKLYFQTAAKVASQTAEAWMKCRFDGEHGPKADDDYTRLMFVRNPAGRAISGYYQQVSHYIELMKLPPDKLAECAQAFPEEAKWPSDTAGTAGWPIGSYVIEGVGPSTCAVVNRSAVTDSMKVAPKVGFELPDVCKEAFERSNNYLVPHYVVPTEEKPHPDKLESKGALSARERQYALKGKFQCGPTGLSLNQTMTTAQSALYNAMWKLPTRCRLPLPSVKVFGTNDTLWDTLNMTFEQIRDFEDLPSWLCPPGEDCNKDCDVDDHTFAQLFAHGLSDAARMRGPGCSGDTFAGEHVWSEYTHLSPIGHVDAMIRLEDIAADSKRFEALVEKKTGEQLPKAADECDLEKLEFINNAKDADSGVSHIPWHDTDRLKTMIDRSPDLQRRVCALYYHDFVCLGYEMLDACKGPAEEWLGQALDDLMKDAPLKTLKHPSHAKHKPQKVGYLR